MSPPPFEGVDEHRKQRMSPRAKVPRSVRGTCQTASHPSSRWSPSAAPLWGWGPEPRALRLQQHVSHFSWCTFKLTYFPFVSFGAHRQDMAPGQNDLPFVGLLDSTESCQWFLLQPGKKKQKTCFLDKRSRCVTSLTSLRHIMQFYILPNIWSSNADGGRNGKWFVFLHRKSHYELKVASSDF